MIESVRIQAQHIRLIRDECIKHRPNEACGVLIGWQDGGETVVDMVVPVKNSRPSNRSFELDATEQYNAWNLAEQKGMDIVGVYHTHPHSQARPSAWDMESMVNYRTLWVILGKDGIRGFEWVDGVSEIEIIEVD